MTEQARILIVDDEPAVRTALRLAIRRKPWQIEEVESAESALMRLQSDRFDAALIDKNLPGISGIELIREIRKTDQSLAIIVITGFASSESATEALHLGIDAYLEKPFDNVYNVAGKVEDILAARKRQRQSGEHAAIDENFTRALDVLQGRSTQTKHARKLKILVVCSLESERKWFVEQFQSDTTEIVEVSSSGEALRHCDANPDPNLVITDTSIQEPDVVAFIGNMRHRLPRAGFVVVAERSPVHLKLLISLIALGVRVLLERPLDRESLGRKLEYIGCKLQTTTQSLKRAEGKF